MKIHDLAVGWNAWYNGVLIQNPQASYLVVSAERAIVAWAAWLMLRALFRYASVALPPPHTADNVAYWVRWWLWLRLREFPAIKVGAFLFALLLLLQIPTGIDGALSGATRYILTAYASLVVLLIGLTHVFNTLRHRIEHPKETP